jgi:hypothetical protein
LGNANSVIISPPFWKSYRTYFLVSESKRNPIEMLGFSSILEARIMNSDAIQLPDAPGIHGLRFKGGEDGDNI